MIPPRPRFVAPRWRGVAHAVLPTLALGLVSANAAPAESPRHGQTTQKPAPTALDPKAAAERDRDRLKSLQQIVSGSPPAAPSAFSPDPDRNRLPFPPSLLFPETAVLFPEIAGEWTARISLSAGTPPLAPGQFNPDPLTGPGSRRWFAEGSAKLKLELTFTQPPSPKSPQQFNPDPGAQNQPPAERPFFKPEFTLAPDYGSEPVPPSLAWPRAPLRLWEFVPPAAGPPFTFGSEPVPTPPRTVRSVEVVPATSETKQKFGLEPLVGEQQLPRANTRRNLPFHPHFESAGLPRDPQVALPPATESKNDRWRAGFLPWRRYTTGSGEDPFYYHEPRWWHPYYQSRLKGDLPVIGQDIFLNLTASTSTEFETKRLPIPSGVSAATAGQAEFFGRSEVLSIQNNVAFAVELFRGETVFKPVEWAIKLQPVYNVNYVNANETGVVSPDPRGLLGGGAGSNGAVPGNGFVTNPTDIDLLLGGQLGVAGDLTGRRHTVRTRDFWALQEGFFELHLRDLSDNYDFAAFKAGNQTFTSDFRGFLFNDTNLGFRLFGNAWNNRLQYNLAGFDMREKDTNSDLNTFDQRNQRVVIANLFWQDFLAKGYTATWSFHANLDDAGVHYDRNGAIVRPAPIGTVRAHEVNAYYLGWGGDGHIGRWNVSHQFYQAFGRDSFNGIAGQPVDINAQFVAAEVSYDRDWLRYKASFVYASGDHDATDGKGGGFDTIIDNPNFTGGPFSYYMRQGFNLAGSSVGLKQRGSLIPNLRTSKTQGQANFVNPGVFLFGLGLEADVTPKAKAFLNLNYIRFAETDALQTTLFTDKIGHEVGYDLSLGVQYRPFLTDNVIVSAGWGVLLPGRGFKDIYQRSSNPTGVFDSSSRAGKVDDFLYSGLIAITLTY